MSRQDREPGLFEVRRKIKEPGEDMFREFPNVPQPERGRHGHNRLNADSIESSLFALLSILNAGDIPSSALMTALSETYADWRAIKTTTCCMCRKAEVAWEKDYGIEYAEWTVCWGYNSRKDLEQHYITLCEDCYDEVILKRLGDAVVNDSYDYGNVHSMIERGELLKAKAELHSLKTGDPIPPHKRLTWQKLSDQLNDVQPAE